MEAQGYEKLVKALRCKRDDCEGCDLAFLDKDEGWMCRYAAKDDDAAAAIEELIESVHIRDKTLDELNHYIWKLEAEVKRPKEANDELREAQTYIDHYGDRWMTSAKDVPSSAYEHGYADGMAEVKAQLPKRGQWELIDGAEPMRWGCSRCKYLSWETSNYCPRCGAKMTEVQDA